MNKNFMVFGDSISYGHELSDAPHDTIKSDVIQPSKFSWPSLLGAVNCSVPGSGNDRIKRNCLHTTVSLQPKLVGISWSFPERFELPDPMTDKLEPENDFFTTIGHWIQGRKNAVDFPELKDFNVPNIKLKKFKLFVNLFYKFIYSDVYGIYNFLDNVYTTQLHLKNLNIEYFMVTPSHKTLQLNDKYLFKYENDLINMDKIIGSVVRTSKLIDWSKFIFIDEYKGIMDIGKEFNDIGEHGHPLKKTHEFYANHLKDVII